MNTIPDTCRSCGREIVWLKTKAGKDMPTDAETVGPGDEVFDGRRHMSHFATCPQPEVHPGTGSCCEKE
jgi:hypothetical protein